MYSYETTIRPSQVGPNNAATLAGVVTLMQDCSIQWMDSEPAFSAFLKETNTGLMIGSRQVEVVRFPEYREQVRVETRVYKNTPMLGYRNTYVYDSQGEALAKSWSTGAFVNLTDARLARIPDDILDVMVVDEKLDMNYRHKKIHLPQVAPVECEPYKVARADIDGNRHMNNVHYVRVANECVPADAVCKDLRIEYKAQARCGDVLRTLVYEEPGRIVVNLAQANGDPYALVEFAF